LTAPFERLRVALAGRYALERELGRGGMATVYYGQDLKHRRSVAIKVLQQELATALGVERFRREIEMAAGLTHPHILPLFDSGEADGLFYYVMPYIEGQTLRGRLDQERQLPIEDAVRIACDVAAALACAHARGVLHRDIKPENIMFSAGRAVVADFGIARMVSAASLERITGTGVAIGTPAYMSPEQALADPQLDGRTDVYSLGCVVYEMLTGSPPFTGPTAQAVLARHTIDPAPSIRGVRPTVSSALERAILKALAKAPADRFGSATQFAAALTAPVEGPADGESIAVLPFVNLSADPDTEYFSDGIAEEIINALAQLPGLRVAARTSSFAFRGHAIDLAEVGAKLKVATVLEGSVRKAGTHLRVTAQLIKVADGYHLWSERYDREMTDVFAIQDEIARAIADRLQVTFGGRETGLLVTPPTQNLDAYHLYLKGRYYWAQRGLGLKKALDCFGQALALDPNYALAHTGLADACALLAEYGIVVPKVILPKARVAIQRALELAPDLAEAHCAQGTLKLVFDWDWPGASRDLRRAIELNPRYVAARYRLALYLTLIESEFEQGIAHARRAVELDPLAPLPLGQLGAVLIAAGRHEEAIAPLKRAVELGPGMLLPLLHLGVIYHCLGRTREAIEIHEIAAASSGRNPLTIAHLAVFLSAEGKDGEAQALYDELEARSRREYVLASTLAFAAAALGRIDEAFQLLHRACDDRDAALIYAKRYPTFRLLQGDPRMTEIYRRIGLPD